MYKNQRILCIITARGGSKRLPGKNIMPLLGVPLVGYAIRAAKASQYVDKVVVSTDDESIARIARKEGAEVPFMRPAELANDTAKSIPVLQHAVRTLQEQGEAFDLIMLIQPTVPGILVADVDGVVETLDTSGTNSCISVCEITDRPEWMYRLGTDARITPFLNTPAARVQDMQELFRINGAVYLVRRDVLMEQGKLIDSESASAVVMPRERSIDIDTQADFNLAEMYLRAKL